MENLFVFFTRLAEFLYLCALNWVWFLLGLSSGYFLTRLTTAFLPVKPRRGWRIALLLFLGFNCFCSD